MSKRCPECDREYDDAESFCSHDGRSLSEAGSDPLVGRVLDGRYRVDRLLGAGGMGVVYAATQLSLDRDVALKLLRRSRLGDAVALKRFEREARAVSRLTSPHTVRLFDFGKLADGELFMVMEHLHGRTLASRLESGPLDPSEALRIADGITHSLAEAHAAGIVHRDLKPANVFLCSDRGPDEHPVVLDFGIAAQEADTALTDPERQPGTPGYIAPEALAGAVVDARADVYAIGAIFYSMLAGKPPFEGASSREIASAQLHGDPEPLATLCPDAPVELRRLVMRCLARDPRLRPADASEMREALGRPRVSGTSRAGLDQPTETSDGTSESLEGIGATREAETGPRAPSTPPGPPARWGVAVVLTAAVAGGALVAAFVRDPPTKGLIASSSEPSGVPRSVASATASVDASALAPLEAVVPVAMEFARAVSEERFGDLEKHLEEPTSVAWPADQRVRVWRQLQAELGAFQKIAGTRQVREHGRRAVFVEMVLERATLDLKLIFEESGKVSGVWFTNPLPLPSASGSARLLTPAIQPSH